MILTQTCVEVGCTKPAKGSIYLQLEPMDHRGFGMSRESCVKLINERFEKEYPGLDLLNAKHTFRPGGGHSSYGRQWVVLTGDLYE